MITDEQLRQLAASGEFQELLQNDEHIKKLEALKYNPRDEYIALSDVLGWNPMFRSLKLRRLTPALWAFLWTLRSPYTQEEMYKADELDTDIFLYLLTVDLREGDVSPKKIVIAAIGFCRKHGICWQEAREHGSVREFTLPSGLAGCCPGRTRGVTTHVSLMRTG